MVNQNGIFSKTLLVGVILMLLCMSTIPSVAIVNKKVSIYFLLKKAPLAYWAFDECSGTTAGDSVHGYNGKILGATWTTEGYSGCALVFDGEDDYVDLDPHAPNLGLNKTDDYLISAYFKSTSTFKGSIFSMSHTIPSRAFVYLDLNSDGTLSFKTGGETYLFELYTNSSYNDGVWHLVEVKFYGKSIDINVEIYIDGDLKAEKTDWLYPYIAEDFITAKIGRRSVSQDFPFNGTIDEVRIYKSGPMHPPDKPVITGPSNGKVNTEYNFTFTYCDEQDQDIFYDIDWGDGSAITTSPQMESGETFIAGHKWSEKGTYTIKATATNLYGETSETGTKNIEIKRTRATFNPSFYWLFERFPLLEKLLNLLLL